MNDNDDDVLVAWLNARDFMVVRDTFERTFLRPRYLTAFEHGPVEAKHLAMWVDPRYTDRRRSIELFATQRGKRRPLRSLVREWVLGL